MSESESGVRPLSERFRETRATETVRCNLTRDGCPFRARHVLKGFPDRGLCGFHYLGVRAVVAARKHLCKHLEGP